MALPATMTSVYKPLAQDVLLLDVAKKDSTGPSNARPPIASATDSKRETVKISPESVAWRIVQAPHAPEERKTAKETDEALASPCATYWTAERLPSDLQPHTSSNQETPSQSHPGAQHSGSEKHQRIRLRGMGRQVIRLEIIRTVRPRDVAAAVH